MDFINDLKKKKELKRLPHIFPLLYIGRKWSQLWQEKRMKRQAENHIIQKAPTYKIQTKAFYINTKTHGEVLKRIMRNTKIQAKSVWQWLCKIKKHNICIAVYSFKVGRHTFLNLIFFERNGLNFTLIFNQNNTCTKF